MALEETYEEMVNILNNLNNDLKVGLARICRRLWKERKFKVAYVEVYFEDIY